jgi:H+-translocating NAD(P) transhydrogenase subunit alpha
MNEILLMLGIFAVTSAISYALISRVPQRLHTPLMSFTNAISAVTILGALLLFAHDTSPTAAASGLSVIEVLLGGLAVILAAFNLVGGFAITDRMTRMFKR